tara:strand:+ start:201 stop:449 length:249 start_codon:yes stop_codon:yes gene_type:complete
MVEKLRADGILDSLDADPLVHTINKKIEHIMLEPVLEAWKVPKQWRRKPKDLKAVLVARGQVCPCTCVHVHVHVHVIAGTSS